MLTTTLRAQHAQLRSLLEDVRRLGISTDAGREALQKAERLVGAHLALEEAKLYPALRTHPSTRDMAHQYADEMEKLTPAVLAFFEAHRDGTADALGFARSLGQLLGTLNQRINREEVRLYPAYETHCEQAQ